ncbi:uncharacterized protein LOC124906005 [Homo sapiens]|uniref:uncharacterized protein LOC124906005 n=1 Tax=Homo sapiens TaxID=9606 RepID=UPI001FB121F9|nr:uncharacterized protein LOC124906005 [Homo sapiens]
MRCHPLELKYMYTSTLNSTLIPPMVHGRGTVRKHPSLSICMGLLKPMENASRCFEICRLDDIWISRSREESREVSEETRREKKKNSRIVRIQGETVKPKLGEKESIQTPPTAIHDPF